MSVIVLWRDHAELLILWEQNMRFLTGVDVIFIDNGSADKTKIALHAFCNKYNIRLVRNAQNCGFSAANNQGAAIATGEYILYLNNNIEIYHLPLDVMCEKTGDGVSGPVQSKKNGELIYPEGWALCIKKSTLEAIGGWCEDYKSGCWDGVDISVRVVRAGYPMVLIPELDIWVCHLSNTIDCDGRFDKKPLDDRNRVIFTEKYFSDEPSFCNKTIHALSVIKTPEKRCLIVLGMHRSGTSAFTGFLSLLGVETGSTLMPAKPDNPRGFFEQNEIVERHDYLLKAIGSSWHDERYLPPDWLSYVVASSVRQELESIFQREFGRSGLFVIKDPRMCRLLPLWLEIFEKNNVTPLFILLTRHPKEVSASLARRNNLPEYKSMLLWLSHVLEAELVSRAFPRIVIDYSDLLSDWKFVAQQIAENLGIDFPISPERAEPEVSEFLTSELRHHRFAEDALKNEGSPKSSLSLACNLYNLLRDKRRRDKEFAIDVLYLKYLHALSITPSP